MLLWILAALALYAITGNFAGSALTVALVWWFFGSKTVTDPDKAYGEVDTDGDFGN